MAILGFHFSGVYKDKLLSGKKTATIMEGKNFFRPGQEVFVYLSEKPNLFDGKIEQRIGKAEIEKNEIKKVGSLSEEEAKACGYDSLEELKQDLKKWYSADEDSAITFIRFSLSLG